MEKQYIEESNQRQKRQSSNYEEFKFVHKFTWGMLNFSQFSFIEKLFIHQLPPTKDT